SAFIRLFSIVVAFALVAGCGPSASGETVLRCWAMGREGEVVAALLPEFEQANPGIRVKVQQLPWTAAHEKLLTAFAGDATPDICQLGNTWIPELHALNALEPLDRDADSSAIVRADDYFAGIWDTNRIDGSLYGVPWYVDTRLIFFRTDRLARGRFAFYVSGAWNIGELQRRLPRDQQDNWMTAPLPGPDGPGASIAGGSSLVVFRASRHKAAAWRLVEFLSQPSVQRRFHALTGDLPPRRATWDDPALANDVHARAFREQLERVKPAPKVPEWERIATEIRLVAERAAHGEVSVDEAARVLDTRAARIL